VLLDSMGLGTKRLDIDLEEAVVGVVPEYVMRSAFSQPIDS
jgi:hypothetical protein